MISFDFPDFTQAGVQRRDLPLGGKHFSTRNKCWLPSPTIDIEEGCLGKSKDFTKTNLGE
jgi:hypothetical protein